MDRLTRAYDDDPTSDSVFIDFSKPFDMAPHAPLLHRPNAYGCDDKLPIILENVLS